MKIIIFAALLVTFNVTVGALTTFSTRRGQTTTGSDLAANVDAIFPTVASTSAPSKDDEDIDDFVAFKGERHDEFDWSLIKSVLLKEDSNIIFSPFSVKLLLTLLLEASAEKTKTNVELSKVIPNSVTQIREYYGEYLPKLLKENDNYKLKIATRMFVSRFIEPKQRYSGLLERWYQTRIDALDFTDTTTAKDYINEWCSNSTNGHIKKIVESDDIANSIMIMINTMYFKGLWRRPFNEDNTVDLPFHLNADKRTKANYMTDQGKYFFHESQQMGVKVLRIPYKGKKFALNIMLPSAKGGLNELIRQLEVSTLRNSQWLMDDVEVKVQIPKFKFEYQTQIKSTLQELGISEVFTNQASLPNLDRGEHLHGQLRVSNAIQKAGIAVNEQGSTAYAATEVQIVNKFGDPTHEFIANRPFLFFIEDESTGTLLFVGKITNPDEFNNL